MKYIIIETESFTEEFKKEDVIKTLKEKNTGKVIFFLSHGIQAAGYEHEIKEITK